MNVAVLTISDSSYAGERADLSGPQTAALCEAQGWSVIHREVIPDERAAIAAALTRLAPSCDLILTTGGTGITARDVTPEATLEILDKELPGLTELMRAEGLKFTRRAVLSRARAGSRGKALIINLPGSPKGATQALGAILDLVPHIVELLHGSTGHPEESKLG